MYTRQIAYMGVFYIILAYLFLPYLWVRVLMALGGVLLLYIAYKQYKKK
ncbi:MAG: hypothetical protein QM526_01545 [Alphaproteobacteria bacterium]|nr:hypothetical protein [Alphaproteobacteria bacterium]